MGFTLLVSTTLGFLTTRLRRVHFRSSLGCSPARVSSRAFPPTLTTTALYRSSLESVWDLLLKADPEGPSLIYCAAFDPHGYLVHGELLIRVLLQHTEAKKIERLRFPFSTPPPLVDRIRTKFQKSRFLGMQFQVELPHSFREFRPKLIGIRFAPGSPARYRQQIARRSHRRAPASVAMLGPTGRTRSAGRCWPAAARHCRPEPSPPHSYSFAILQHTGVRATSGSTARCADPPPDAR